MTPMAIEARHLAVPFYRYLLTTVFALSSVVIVQGQSSAQSSVKGVEGELKSSAAASSSHQRPVAAGQTGETSAAPAERTSVLSFPLVSQDSLASFSAVQCSPGKTFPSAVEVKGNARGLLLHARKETKYDLLSPVSLWLEQGPLLVAVRTPSNIALIATKFGDVCVTVGADALLERGEGTLRVTNLSSSKGTVNLVLHDRQWQSSPWSHLVKAKEVVSPKSKGRAKKNAVPDVESGTLSLAPGYELVIADHSLENSEIKLADSIGRRDFKLIGDTGRFAVCEVSIDNIVQLHDLIRNLKEHGERANSVLSEITRVASQFKVKQGEDGFEKVAPALKASDLPKKQIEQKKTTAKPPVTATTSKKQGQLEKPPVLNKSSSSPVNNRSSVATEPQSSAETK